MVTAPSDTPTPTPTFPDSESPDGALLAAAVGIGELCWPSVGFDVVGSFVGDIDVLVAFALPTIAP